MPESGEITRVAVFGGSGFLGHRICEQLAAAGIEARAAVRHPEKASKGDSLTAVAADVRDEGSVARALEGCGAAVNAVGLYVEKGDSTFEAVHEKGAHTLAAQAAKQGVKRLVHLSGLGSDPNASSHYVSSRGRGEAMVREAFPEAVIFRPSVMFAPDDGFVNALADIAKLTPVLPLVGSGETRLQPVFSGDVARAAVEAIRRPDSAGTAYALGGPDVLTYRQIVEKILDSSGRRRLLLPLPFPLWSLLALLAKPLPSPPITEGQVALLRTDNVAPPDAPGLDALGVTPTPLDAVLPEYRF